MRRAIVVLALLTPAVFAQVLSSGRPTATVTMHVVDAGGKTVDNCRIDRFVRQDPTDVRKKDLDMTANFNGLRGTEIPFGTYFYTLKRKLGGGREGSGGGTILVSRVDTYSVIQADLGLLAGMIVDGIWIPDRKGIKGSLEPPPPLNEYEPTWIRLSPIYGGDHFDVAVSKAGEFRIYDAPPGLYTLTVVQAGRVIQMQPIQFRHVSLAQPLVVRIPKNPPEVLDVHESVGNINEDTRN